MRYCHVSRVNYLNRSVPSNHLQAAASYHDHLTQSTFKQLVRCHDLDYMQSLQVTLPIKYGGFGMTSMAQSCGAAFVASWTQSIIDLTTLFTNLQSSITRLCSLTTTTGGNGHHLSQALPPGKRLSGLLENPLKVQHNLTYNHVSEVVSQLLGSDQPSRTKARLRSLQGKGAGAWLGLARDYPILIRFRTETLQLLHSNSVAPCHSARRQEIQSVTAASL